MVRNGYKDKVYHIKEKTILSRLNLSGINWDDREERNRYQREYSQRPKAKKYHREYMKQYYHRPEVKEKLYQRRKHTLVIRGKIIYGLNKRDWTGYCELCGRKDIRISYHHWDDKNFSKGIWVDNPCHWMCEQVDKYGLQIMDRYQKFRRILDNGDILLKTGELLNKKNDSQI